MKSREQIEMDFSRAVSKAQELEEIATELSNVANGYVEGGMLVLKSAWMSENASLFAKKGRIVSKDIYDTADDIMRIAKSIRSTADIVYRAEKAATMIVY